MGNKAITANHDRLLKDDEGRRGDKSKSVRVRGAGRAGSNSHELIGQFSKSGQQRERERERETVLGPFLYDVRARVPNGGEGSQKAGKRNKTRQFLSFKKGEVENQKTLRTSYQFRPLGKFKMT